MQVLKVQGQRLSVKDWCSELSSKSLRVQDAGSSGPVFGVLKGIEQTSFLKPLSPKPFKIICTSSVYNLYGRFKQT
jgi:hypothetical protein